ncbi:MAG: hypothetical protein AAF654_07990 [Myxococcota bacterium]
MSKLRFDVGAIVMCNLGPSGWKPGRIIALHYRELDWPAEKTAPYQVALEADHTLIYVPEDDARFCREATVEEIRIALRLDALAELPVDPGSKLNGDDTEAPSDLGCADGPSPLASASYRRGRCRGCDCCPESWSSVELYSENYGCAARNELKVTRRRLDLGVFRVGDSLDHSEPKLPARAGFLQCPTLARLPPGVRVSDDGLLTGEVRFDPHRADSYKVDFVAVSTAAWDNPAVGITRLEICFVVEGNQPPNGFDVEAFQQDQQQARNAAALIVRDLVSIWRQWEEGELSNRETCDEMYAELRRLRNLLERHPRLDGGRWWVQLGGFHMNVHKLLENTLFECELYLGHALTFGDPEVRRQAELNLEGCYQKRLLEAARFMWIDGVGQMMRGEWSAAAATLRLAAGMKEGWGWAVNYGDIWLSESAARLVHGAELVARDDGDGAQWILEAEGLLEKAGARADDAEVFGPGGHPWASEIRAAIAVYRSVQERDAELADWIDRFKSRTVYWCAQVLSGMPPFPPKPQPRVEDAAELVRRLPGYN